MKALDVKIGSNPISSANDDLSELGADTPLETILSEVSETGQRGWLVVEAKQDPAAAPGYQYAQMGFRHLSELKRSLERQNETPSGQKGITAKDAKDAKERQEQKIFSCKKRSLAYDSSR